MSDDPPEPKEVDSMDVGSSGDSSRWRFLEHTADIRMEALGSSLEELFVNAALGLASLLIVESRSGPSETHSISLSADDVDELLVNWLREIHFLHEVRRFVPVRVDIGFLSETALEAEIDGRIEPEDAEGPEVEIKAVTYHDALVRRSEDCWSARVVFDI